jgi:6-phosphogluconolactonase
MKPPSTTIYAGTYTEGTQSRGIYAFRFHSDGSLESLGCVALAINPSFLCLDLHKLMIYAVEETLGGSSREGAILAYQVDRATGSLNPVGRVGSGGVGPCFLALAKTRGSLLVANYHSGSIGSVRLTEDGNLASHVSHVTLSGAGLHPQRQAAPHAHAIVTCCEDRYAIVADLGSDSLHVFGLSPTGELSESPIATRTASPGSGPRHLVVHTNGRYLYVVNEISADISFHRIDTPNWISPALQVIPVAAPCGSEILDAADIVIDDSGGKLYTCTRRSNNIRSFTIDPTNGFLTYESDLTAGGLSPHSLCLEPGGRWMASSNHLSDNVVIFDRSQSKYLTPIHTLGVPGVACTVFFC